MCVCVYIYMCVSNILFIYFLLYVLPMFYLLHPESVLLRWTLSHTKFDTTRCSVRWPCLFVYCLLIECAVVVFMWHYYLPSSQSRGQAMVSALGGGLIKRVVPSWQCGERRWSARNCTGGWGIYKSVSSRLHRFCSCGFDFYSCWRYLRIDCKGFFFSNMI